MPCPQSDKSADALFEPLAADILYGILDRECICGGGMTVPAPCQTNCTQECADPTAMLTPACEACIDSIVNTAAGDECFMNTGNACAADPACLPVLECYDTCP